MKIVIYTCLTGGYDKLSPPKVVDDRCDYLCFTNDLLIQNNIGVWRFVPIEYESDDLIRQSRYPKILPCNVLKDYDYSVYIDSNITIVDDRFYQIIYSHINKGSIIAQVNHPSLNCIYEDIRSCLLNNKISIIHALEHFRFLKSEKFPPNIGLYENNIIFRNHNDSRVIEISRMWWNLYNRFSSRDQLSLMYVYWKFNFLPNQLFNEGENTRNVFFLKYSKHTREHKETFWEMVYNHIRYYIYIFLRLFV